MQSQLPKFEIPGEHVGAENATYDIAKVGHIVHVRQSTSN